MSESEHAPGPWYLERGQVLDADGNPVILRGFTLSTGHDFRRAQTDANRDVAMAAPELLAACEAVRRTFEPGDNAMAGAEVLDLVDAAIAKARGTHGQPPHGPGPGSP